MAIPGQGLYTLGPMKLILSLCLILSGPFAAAATKDLSGPEAAALFHVSVYQVKVDLKAWLANSRQEVEKIRKSSPLSRQCLQGQDTKKCEQAIQEVTPYSVFRVRDPQIFQLDTDLKTKYKLDIETGMRVFQLSTGLRWMARPDVYNGVVAPKQANRKTYSRFLADIDQFHKNKSLELRKAEPMIPAPKNRFGF